MTEDDLRAILRELKNEPVPTDSLARVRSAVAEATVKAPVRSWFSLAWKAVGAVAVAAIVLVLFWRPHIPHQTASPVAVTRPSVQTDRRPPTPPVVAVSGPKRPKRLKQQHAPAVQDAAVVRIETDDPDVVILLVSD